MKDKMHNLLLINQLSKNKTKTSIMKKQMLSIVAILAIVAVSTISCEIDESRSGNLMNIYYIETVKFGQMYSDKALYKQTDTSVEFQFRDFLYNYNRESYKNVVITPYENIADSIIAELKNSTRLPEMKVFTNQVGDTIHIVGIQITYYGRARVPLQDKILNDKKLANK